MDINNLFLEFLLALRIQSEIFRKGHSVRSLVRKGLWRAIKGSQYPGVSFNVLNTPGVSYKVLSTPGVP